MFFLDLRVHCAVDNNIHTCKYGLPINRATANNTTSQHDHGINIDTNNNHIKSYGVVGLSKVNQLGIDRMPILSFLVDLFFYFGDFDPQSITTTQHRHHINITSNPPLVAGLFYYFMIEQQIDDYNLCSRLLSGLLT